MDFDASTNDRPPRFGIAVQSRSGPHVSDPFFEELLAGMEEELDRHGATVFLRQFTSSEDELKAYPLWARSGAVDAVVLADAMDGDTRAAVCIDAGLPAVILGGPPEPGVSLVDVDNSGAMEMAVDFLTGLGHRFLGRVSGPAHLHHTKARSTAFEGALARKNLTGVSVEGDYTSVSGALRTKELLTAAERPTAIIYDNGVMAVAALAAVRELGLTVPEDVSLLAWDDGPHCRLADPPLSVVSLDVYELGKIAAELLMETYSGSIQTIVHVPTGRVVIRGSTSPWKGAGPDPQGPEPAPAVRS